MYSIPTSSFLRVAHRGGSALAPENTLAAFRHALTLPVDALELDVQMSCDGHALVFHDETVERLSTGQGNLLDLDLAYLRSLDVAAHFPGGWPQPQQMPTLGEVLTLAKQGEVQVLLEIKPGLRAGQYCRYPGIVEAVARAVLDAGMCEQVLVMSFDWEVLPQIKRLLPGVRTGVLVSEDVWPLSPADALTKLVAQARTLQCEWIHLDATLFTSALPAFFHAHSLQLGLWTVNDQIDLQSLAQMGVDALTTDHPDFFSPAEP
jgi:glycerophosphoryl diester phosphodiesterase